MSDESKTADTIPEPKPATTTAPAVQTSELWGGPQWLESGSPEPEFVATKQEYWDRLNRLGLRMPDQQESTTGPERERIIEAPSLPEPVLDPIGKDEAHVYGALLAVFKRRGLMHSTWCDDCFAHGRFHQADLQVTPRYVRIVCGCGTVEYRPPVGTTDLVLNTIATDSIVEVDKTQGTVYTPKGQFLLPTFLLSDVEAYIIRHAAKSLLRRHKEPRWFHVDCYKGDPRDQDNCVGLSVSDDITILCPCQLLFHRKTRH